MKFAKKIMTEKAEKLNGKAAMLGMFALVGAYYFTGQILPGICLVGSEMCIRDSYITVT